MKKNKNFKTYYLLLVEGTTEFNLFAYLTKKKFRDEFEKSNIKFSNKVTVICQMLCKTHNRAKGNR